MTPQKKAENPKYDPLDVNCQENINAYMSNMDFLQSFVGFGLLFVFAYLFGWVIAIPLAYAMPFLKVWVMKKVFGLEHLTCMDTFFLYDDYKNRANIMAISIFHKVNKEKVIAQYKQKAFVFDKMRSRLVKTWFGEYFWQRMPDSEFNQVVDKLIVDLKDRDIHDEDALADFVGVEQQVKNCLHLPQWRVFVKEDYKPGQSLLILKMHHTMTDGYGVAQMLANVSDMYDEHVLPQLPTLKWWQVILMYLSMPYYSIIIALKYFTYVPDNNPLRSVHPENSGVKKGYFAKDYMLEDIKRVARAHKVTINDLIMTTISMTVK